jgi:hypothetical protein
VRFNVGLKGGGFNERNKKERKSPIDQDTARKFFTDTAASELEDWYNTDVQKWVRKHRGYSDKEGIFILDPTLIGLSTWFWYGPGRQMARVRLGPWLPPRNSEIPG